MIEVISRTAENPEEAVVAALERAVVRQKAEMPFADQGCAISRALQQRSADRFLSLDRARSIHAIHSLN